MSPGFNNTLPGNLIFLIPLPGRAICVVTLMGIIAALIRISHWKHTQYNHLKGHENDYFPFQKKLPNHFWRWLLPALGFIPTILIPLLIILAWGFILHGGHFLWWHPQP
jgi:H+/Cl- antiporter ClcA